jgi:hypothetical protein
MGLILPRDDAMIRVFHACEFQEPTCRGLNKPMIIRGETDAGESQRLFLKSRAGYANRPNAAGVEMFTTLLARSLGLKAPEPVVVVIPNGFERLAREHPVYQDLLRGSFGNNFGTVALGPDWKTLPVGMGIQLFPRDTVESILTFDALVQQDDRDFENPNLQWNGDQIAILDHERCFGHLGDAGADQYPWRKYLGKRPLRQHCLRSLAGDVDASFGKHLREEWLELEMDGRLPGLLQASCRAFPEATLDLNRIDRYLSLLTAGYTDFREYLQVSLQS